MSVEQKRNQQSWNQQNKNNLTENKKIYNTRSIHAESFWWMHIN